jgi:hypothetical protein
MRTTRTAALVTAAILALGTWTFAQDFDRDGYRGSVAQCQQYGYQSGYNDGLRKGRHEGRENDLFDYHTPDWLRASQGYQPWMGPLNVFQRGYQQGYAAGFRTGFATERPGWRDGDDFRPNDYRGGYDNVGYNVGFQDGASVARDDISHNKPFNPNPRGRYDDMDHGYRREYGDKYAYKADYAAGYRAGYQSVFRGRY